MLVQMAGVFLFWWLLTLGVAIAVVLTVEKYLLRPRKSHARANGFGLLLGQKPEPQPVEAQTAPAVSGASPGQPRVLFQAPLAEPRRYFIGQGPVDAHEKV